MLRNKEKWSITKIYKQVYAELKERYGDKEVPIINFDNIIRKKLSENNRYTQENLNYLRGFFRKNRILVYNPKNGYLKWG